MMTVTATFLNNERGCVYEKIKKQAFINGE